MNIEDQRALVSEWYTGFTHRDAKQFLSSLAEDVKIQAAGNSPFSGTYVGKETVGQGLDQLFGVFAPEENLEEKSQWKIMVADGARVAGMMNVYWKSATTGSDYHQTYCQVFEFNGEKISRIWEFLARH